MINYKAISDDNLHVWSANPDTKFFFRFSAGELGAVVIVDVPFQSLCNNDEIKNSRILENRYSVWGREGFYYCEAKVATLEK